ncbi:phosphoribosyl anthranilate isomerase [Pyrodictium delaneyi]|nr:hypothetical protein [Pyrodictium delaneyi]ALL00984.1 phosphoribosyl anthranilate isomerase [Pyrodictium delaneyi]
MLRPKLKICGLTRRDDVEALDGLADYLGFIVAREKVSPRVLEPSKARDLVETVAKSRRVLVAHGYTPHEALDLAARLEVFHVLQYHQPANPGELESLATGLEELGMGLAPVSLWNGERLAPDPCSVAQAVPVHEYLLVDALKTLKKRYRAGLRVPLDAYCRAVSCTERAAAAGGIDPGNVCLAASTGVYMIDVSSGVEAEPGRKDLEKVKQLIEVLGQCS